MFRDRIRRWLGIDRLDFWFRDSQARIVDRMDEDGRRVDRVVRSSNEILDHSGRVLDLHRDREARLDGLAEGCEEIRRNADQLNSQVRYLVNLVGRLADEVTGLKGRLEALEADAAGDRWSTEYTFGSTTALFECRGDFDNRLATEARLVGVPRGSVGVAVERLRATRGYGGVTIVVPADIGGEGAK